MLCDDGDGLVERAADDPRRAGYTDCPVCRAASPAWAKAGFELFSGVNVPSKAFGEHIEHVERHAEHLRRRARRADASGADMVVVDSRPFDEFQRVSIPSATNVPGAELVLRIHDIAPSPDTLVVVNCAGRTRSIIGAQSLINAGLPNKVVALRNGTMGWTLAGLRARQRQGPALHRAVRRRALACAKAAADARRASDSASRASTARRWRASAPTPTRTLYVFDVRDPTEYAAGHLPGAVSAPGGQLVQATDQYVGTLGARIVLVDDSEVRAVMTASWLKQMGWRDVFVLAASGNETGRPTRPCSATPAPRSAPSTTKLSPLVPKSRHRGRSLAQPAPIARATFPAPGSPSARGSPQALPKIPVNGELVLTSEDGVLAGLASPRRDLTRRPAISRGGNAAWQAAGLPLSTEPRMADEPLDYWPSPTSAPATPRAR